MPERSSLRRQRYENETSVTLSKGWVVERTGPPSTMTDIVLEMGSVTDGRADSVVAQVEKQEKKKVPKGRAKKRLTYTRRFVNVVMTGGKRKMNPNPTS